MTKYNTKTKFMKAVKTSTYPDVNTLVDDGVVLDSEEFWCPIRHAAPLRSQVLPPEEVRKAAAI